MAAWEMLARFVLLATLVGERALEPGAPLTGIIEESEPDVRAIESPRLTQRAADEKALGMSFSFTPDSDGPYVIELYSCHGPTHLVLRDADGRVLQEDAGSGINGAATLAGVEWEAGARYRVDACMLPDRVGPFRISVERGRRRDYSPQEKLQAEIEAALECIRTLDTTPTAGMWHRFVAEKYGELGRWREQYRHWHASYEIRKNELGAEDPATATDAFNSAVALYRLRRYEEALPVYREATRVFEATLPEGHIKIAEGLEAVGKTMLHLQRTDEGMEILERAVTAWEAAGGSAGSALAAMAGVCRNRGQIDEADALYRRGLDHARANLPSGSSRLAAPLNEYANFLKMQGRFREAIPLLREAREIAERSFPPNHAAHGAIAGNLGTCLLQTGELSGARDLYESVLRNERRWRGPRDPVLATPLADLGFILREIGDTQAARRVLQEGLDLLEASGGSTDVSVLALKLRINLASTFFDTGDHDVAAARFRAVLAYLEGHEARFAGTILGVRSNLAACLRKLDRGKEALEMLEAVVRDYDAVVDSQHVSGDMIGNAYSNIG